MFLVFKKYISEVLDNFNIRYKDRQSHFKLIILHLLPVKHEKFVQLKLYKSQISTFHPAEVCIAA